MPRTLALLTILAILMLPSPAVATGATFDVRVSPCCEAVSPGGTADFVVTVPSTANASGSFQVDLSVSAPPGWVATLTNASVTADQPAGRSDLAVTVPSSVAAGRYAINVTGVRTDDGETHTTTVFVTVGRLCLPGPAALVLDPVCRYT